MFHGFYNLDHVGDIMLARIVDGKTFSYDKYDDLVVLKDKKENVIGYNLLNASKYLGSLNNGLIKFSDEQVDAFNEILEKYGFLAVTVDKTPRFIVGEVVSMCDHPDSDRCV